MATHQFQSNSWLKPKAEEPPTDSVPKFIKAYSSYMTP